MSRAFRFVTVDVFAGARFAGNPLAVFPEAEGLGDAEMQALAREFNHSETSFVLPPADPANTARVRIFTPTYEMPFAGHPNVGTAWVLHAEGRGAALRFEEIAGLVRVAVDAAGVATVEAPLPLSVAPGPSAALVARAAGVAETAVRHVARASVGAEFVFAELAPGALGGVAPDPSVFREAEATAGGRFSLLLHEDAGPGARRARMFWLSAGGLAEDPATGSAAAALVALLLARDGGERLALTISQGVEMGRPATIRAEAARGMSGEIRSRIGGACVPVLRGEALL